MLYDTQILRILIACSLCVNLAFAESKALDNATSDLSSTWQGKYGFSVGLEDNPSDLAGAKAQNLTFLDCKDNACAVAYSALRGYATCEIDKDSHLLSLRIHSRREATLSIKHDDSDKGCEVDLVRSERGFEVRDSAKAIKECNEKEFESCGTGSVIDWGVEFVREDN